MKFVNSWIMRGKRSDGFALLLVLGILAVLGALMLTAERFVRIQTLRTQNQLHDGIARQNAWTALRAAMAELNETYDGGCCVTARANINGETIPEEHSLWTGVWSVIDGKPVFNRWLISLAGDARFQSTAPWDANADEVAIFKDLGFADACPRLPIISNEKISGHFAYWVEDECDKLRINLPTPTLAWDHILQQFCPNILDLTSETAQALVNCVSFSSMQRCMSGEINALFHNITLCSRGLLKNTAGEWLEDLTLKLQKLPHGTGEYIFSGDPSYPEPPPTFGQLASFFNATKNVHSLGIHPSAAGPNYRIVYPATNALSHGLGDLPQSDLGLNIPIQCGIYPIPVAMFVAVSAEANANQANIHLEPTIFIWNPYNANFAASAYVFQLLSATPSNKAGTLPGFLVETAAGNTTLVRLGINDAGLIFQGEIKTALNAGEVRAFAIDDQLSPIAIPLNLPMDVSTITIQRANSMIGAVSWFNLSMRLLDGNGNLLQEISDFVDGDETTTYVIPRDGERHGLFCFCAWANLGTGANQWLAHYDPRAPQIRRNTFEHAPLFGLSEPFHRHFEPWTVYFCDSPKTGQFPGFFGDGSTSAILFDLPSELFSIGFLQHVPLTPFSYHPAQAVGNSLACPFMSTDVLRWHFISPLDPWNKHAYFRQSMLFDYSYLLNEALYDHYFVSGFSGFHADEPQFFTTCRPSGIGNNFYDSTQIAHNLLLEGAFNVNCTSAKTWKLLLRCMPFDPGTRAYYLPHFVGQSSLGPKFQRQHQLLEDDLDRLAECIVSEIQKYGPFPTLGAFINRELSNGEQARAGLIQRAINMSRINLNLESLSPLSEDRREGSWFNESLAGGATNAHAPAFVTQADFLQFFGNQLIVRSDTFSIRGYGDSVSPIDGTVFARAICEAIVQRMADGQLQMRCFRWIQ
ncbi:MAG: hypothetical protein LBI34_03805 [Puniceicoccales bacterium]|jgi:hypothetical protein|nr:hypothetical protein [Puniceicoccales bacterium]